MSAVRSLTHSRASSPRSPRGTASSPILVKYTKKDTDDALHGDEAAELTAANYGRDEWWLLLEKQKAAV